MSGERLSGRVELFSSVVYTKEEFVWIVGVLLKVAPHELSKRAKFFYGQYLEWAEELPENAKIAFHKYPVGSSAPYEIVVKKQIDLF
jgi:hypothetical protein